MTARGDAIRQSWRDASWEIALTLGLGVVGVVAGLLPGVIGLGWSLGIAAAAIVGVVLVLLAYRRRKAREADAARASELARILAAEARARTDPDPGGAVAGPGS